MTTPSTPLPDAGVMIPSTPLPDVGLPSDLVAAWLASTPPLTGAFDPDAQACGRFWRQSEQLLSLLPPPRRGEAERQAAEAVATAARATRDRFLALHSETVYRRLTNDYGAFVRVERLVEDAAALVPGLTPSPEDVARDHALPLKDKAGVEVDQGIFLGHVLRHARAGAHLCHAMLLPRAESREGAERLARRGSLDLGRAYVERRGDACYVYNHNAQYLNAEDDPTIDALEIAVDVATMDESTRVAVMRGGQVDHPKYRGRRVLGAGLNLTHLYQGKVPFMMYLRREMGYVNKVFRGLALPDALPDECGPSLEKPWVGAVDTFAIGAACQLLLVLDYVVAGRGAYLAVPAHKEGLVPGLTNLRLPRLVGDRLARQIVMLGRTLACDSPEGRLVCDEVVDDAEVDAALERAVAALAGAGMVSAAANRKAFRVGQEPLDLFRRYMAMYARELAYCNFSPALIRNLEQHWTSRERRA